MTHATRRLASFIVVSLALTLVVVGCNAAVGSTAPSAAGPTSALPTASLVPTAAPSPNPSTSAAATASPSSAIACAPLPATLALPTDRVTSVKITPGATSDSITFVFGDSSLPGPASPPMGSLTIAKPPYSQAGSGAPIEMTGDSVLQLRFTGMSLQNDAGEEMFTGPTELTPNLPALRKAVQFDASEGTIGWYVGYNGTGCIRLGHDASTVTVIIDHS